MLGLTAVISTFLHIHNLLFHLWLYLISFPFLALKILHGIWVFLLLEVPPRRLKWLPLKFSAAFDLGDIFWKFLEPSITNPVQTLDVLTICQLKIPTFEWLPNTHGLRYFIWVKGSFKFTGFADVFTPQNCNFSTKRWLITKGWRQNWEMIKNTLINVYLNFTKCNVFTCTKLLISVFWGGKN